MSSGISAAGQDVDILYILFLKIDVLPGFKNVVSIVRKLCQVLCPLEYIRMAPRFCAWGCGRFETFTLRLPKSIAQPRSACSGSTLAQACSGSAHACSALASDPNANKAKAGSPARGWFPARRVGFPRKELVSRSPNIIA